MKGKNGRRYTNKFMDTVSYVVTLHLIKVPVYSMLLQVGSVRSSME